MFVIPLERSIIEKKIPARAFYTYVYCILYVITLSFFSFLSIRLVAASLPFYKLASKLHLEKGHTAAYNLYCVLHIVSILSDHCTNATNYTQLAYVKLYHETRESVINSHRQIIYALECMWFSVR